MKAFENCYNLIWDLEVFSSKPYIDSVGVATIGLGNTIYKNGKKVTMKDKPITLGEAKILSAHFIDKFALDVDLLVTADVTQNQFDALVSFAYNVGSDIDSDLIAEGLGDSTLLKKVNANPNDVTIRNEFVKWNKGTVKGKRIEIKGLTNRRAKESTLYFSK